MPIFDGLIYWIFFFLIYCIFTLNCSSEINILLCNQNPVNFVEYHYLEF